MNNKYRITLVSFLAYFTMSGMLSPIGILVGPMATQFGLPVTEITATFSWLTMGILVGSGVALVIFDWLRIKFLMCGLYTLVACCLAALSVVGNLNFVGAALGMVGICCGIGLAGGASIISRSYHADRRASMLVITDGCFSVAGIICSAIAIYFVGKQWHWSGTYLFLAVIALCIVALTMFSGFPEYKTDDAESSAETKSSGRWPLPLWLCILGLFLYTLGQYSLLWWIPNYAETQLGIAAEDAGRIVGRFWSGMLCAQIFVSWWVLKIGVNRLVILGAVSTALCSIPLWIFQSIDSLLVLAFVWGFANLGLLKVIISQGTLTVRNPPPRIISALLFGATSGTAVSPWVTSQVVELSSNRAVLQFGTGCYLILTLLVLAAVFLINTKPSRL